MAILHAEGAEVLAARDVNEVFAVAQHAELSAAVVDVYLGHSGDCAPICRLLEQRHVPFLFHTGYRKGGVLDEFPKASVLAKPATKEQLLDCIEGVLKNDNPKSH